MLCLCAPAISCALPSCTLCVPCPVLCLVLCPVLCPVLCLVCCLSCTLFCTLSLCPVLCLVRVPCVLPVLCMRLSAPHSADTPCMWVPHGPAQLLAHASVCDVCVACGVCQVCLALALAHSSLPTVSSEGLKALRARVSEMAPGTCAPLPAHILHQLLAVITSSEVCGCTCERCVCVGSASPPSCARLQILKLLALFLRPPLFHSTLHTRGQAFTMNPKLQATALTAIRSVHPTIGKSLFTAPAGAPVASVGSSLIVDVGRCVVSPGLSPSHCLTYRQYLVVFVSRSLARIVEASRPGVLVCVGHCRLCFRDTVSAAGVSVSSVIGDLDVASYLKEIGCVVQA